MAKIQPHAALGSIRPDEVAECWDGVFSAPGGLYEALWACVAAYKAPRPEVSEEPCPGMDTVKGFWSRFSDEHKIALNRLAEENDARIRAWMAA